MTTDVNELLSSTVPDEVARDRWGRYLLEDPTNGDVIPWTRATTISSIVNTTEALEAWKLRNTVFGLGHRPDLYALAASVASTEEKDALTEIVEAAQEAAAMSGAANTGTAIHRFTERIDRGEQIEVPVEWKADVDAYINKLAEHGIGVMGEGSGGEDPLMVERICINPRFRIAGTFDRIIVGDFEKPRIADVKTGKELKYSLGEYAVQQAIYANATHWWDAKNKCYVPMPEDIDKNVAMLIHIPAGQGRCELIELDIAAGWQALQVAFALKAYRDRKDLARPYESSIAINALVDHKTQTDAAKAEAKAIKAAEKKATEAAKPFPCEHCEMGYKSEKGLTNHVANVHTAEEVEAHKVDLLAEEPAKAPEPELEVETATQSDINERVVDIATNEIIDTPTAAVEDERAPLEERFSWVKRRVTNIVHEGHRDRLAEIWNQNSPLVPGFKKGGPTTHEEIDLLGGTCGLVEMEAGLEFFELDPTKQQQTNKKKELIAS